MHDAPRGRGVAYAVLFWFTPVWGQGGGAVRPALHRSVAGHPAHLLRRGVCVRGQGGTELHLSRRVAPLFGIWTTEFLDTVNAVSVFWH